MIEPAKPTGPWSQDQFIRWSTVVMAGVVALVGGWWHASGQARLGDQLPGAALSIAGAALAGWGHVVWLARGRSTIGATRAALLDEAMARNELAPARSEPVAPGDGAGFVAGAGLGLYHLPTCALAAGRGWKAAPLAKHTAAGRRPCGVCRPSAATHNGNGRANAR